MSEKSKGIFYGVVAIATLIVAIVGATLAYFSVFASSNENAVGIKAKVINIVYSDGQNIILPDELIPSAYKYVKASYENPIAPTEQNEKGRPRCIDDRGHQICAVYQFSVENSADDIDLEMYLTVGFNEFTNLWYTLYELDGESRSNIYENKTTLGIVPTADNSFAVGGPDNVGAKVSLVGYDDEAKLVKYPLASGETKTFELVLYLKETSTPSEEIAQDYEQGKSFAGTIQIKAGNNLTGYIEE